MDPLQQLAEEGANHRAIRAEAIRELGLKRRLGVNAALDGPLHLLVSARHRLQDINTPNDLRLLPVQYLNDVGLRHEQRRLGNADAQYDSIQRARIARDGRYVAYNVRVEITYDRTLQPRGLWRNGQAAARLTGVSDKVTYEGQRHILQDDAGQRVGDTEQRLYRTLANSEAQQADYRQQLINYIQLFDYVAEVRVLNAEAIAVQPPAQPIQAQLLTDGLVFLNSLMEEWVQSTRSRKSKKCPYLPKTGVG